MTDTLRIAAVALCAAALCSCAHSPPTRFYALDAVAPAAGAVEGAYRRAPIAVLSVRLPAELDRPELVRREGANRLVVDDFDHWAAPVGELAREALAQDLVARLPAGSVIYPDAQRPPAFRVLTVDVLHFETSGGQGVMDVSWSLSGPVATTRASRLVAPVPGTGPTATAESLGRLIGLLADQITASVASER